MKSHVSPWSLIILVIVILIIFDIDWVKARRGRGKTRGKTGIATNRLPVGATWRDPDTAKYYEHPGAAKIEKASHFDLEYLLGHKIYFVCVAIGNPRPSITWYKDGIELFAHNQLTLHEWRVGKDKIRSKMEIDPATQMDVGIYECYADNKYSFDRRLFRTDTELEE